MVQILREGMRNYQADESGAIRTGQLAQNVQDWGEIATKGANLAMTVGKQRLNDALTAANRENAVAAAMKKQAETADTNIINTQIGQQANIRAQDMVAKQIQAGKLDPYSTVGQAEINRLYADAYKSDLEKMTTDKGRLALQEMSRKGADRGLIASRALYDDYKKELARSAAVMSADSLGQQGYEQGVAQSFVPVEGRDEYVKYVSKKTGAPEAEVKKAVDAQIALSRLMGMAESDPVATAELLGYTPITDDVDTSVRQKLKEKALQNPSFARLSEDEQEKQIDAMIAVAEPKETTQANIDKMREIYGDEIVDSVGDFAKQTLEQDLENKKAQLKMANPASQEARVLKQSIKDLEKKIEKGDTVGDVYDIMRNDAEIQKTVVPIMEKSYNEMKLAQRQNEYNDTVRLFQAGLSPDAKQAAEARYNIWAIQNMGKPQNQSFVEEGHFKNASPEKPQMSYENTPLAALADEVNVNDFMAKYGEYMNNSTKLKEQMFPTYEGTMAMNDKLLELTNMRAGLHPAQYLEKVLDAQIAMQKAPTTQAQNDVFQSILFKTFEDKVFGDEIGAVLNNADRFYPDTTWIDNAFASISDVNTGALVPTRDRPAYQKALGLPEGGIARTDKDAVRKYLLSQNQQAYQNTLMQFAQVANMPAEQRTGAIKQIGADLLKAKQDAYNTAIADYGIDLRYLDDQLNTKGNAYTQIGGRTVAYKGRRDDGTPIFEKLGNKDQIRNEINHLYSGKSATKGE